jgi:hypothetical protein
LPAPFQIWIPTHFCTCPNWIQLYSAIYS